MAESAATHVEVEMERHPWLLRLVRDRLDPATATGLALTLALGLVIVGGVIVGASRVPHAEQRQARRRGPRRRPVGRGQRDVLVDGGAQLVTELGGSTFVVGRP